MPNITINGISLSVPDGTTVLNAARQAGVEIPHYCYHPKLPIAGSCRMCLVEIEKFPKLQTACSTPVAEGMVIRTDSEKVHKAVRGVLELMLINHPIDCPICDQAGECGLQDYYMKYGLHESRFALGDKVRKTKRQDIGGQIVLDSERCILCSRCVRFLREVPGTGELDIFQRGDHSEVSIFPGKPLNNNYTGNLADICPVGALTNKDFRFKCRVWFLKGTQSICTGCATGCNIDAHFRGDVLHRVKPRPNDAVNRGWMCDFGRLEYKKANEGRLLVPVLRENGQQQQAAWESLLYATALRLKDAVETHGPDSVAVIASPQSSNEELYLVWRLAKELLGTPNLTFSAKTAAGNFSDDILIKADKNPNTRGARLLKIPEDNFDAVVKKIADKKIRALLVVGNTLGDMPEEHISVLLANVAFVAQIGTNEGAISRMAHAVMPSASVFERGGTFTNFAGRVQRFRPGFPPRGKARPELDILAGIAGRMGAGWKFDGEESVFQALAACEDAFAGMTYETIGDQGQNVREAENV